MALTKRRHSGRWRDIRRRGQPKLVGKVLRMCKATGILQEQGREYFYQNDLYYNGKIFIKEFKK